MRVIGFNFNKINVEKQRKSVTKISIKTKIDVSEINDVKSDIIKAEESILEIIFNYSVKYSPDFADISLSGSVLITIDSKTAKEILKQWKKKQMPEDFKVFLFNVILKKATLKSLSIEDELGLPLHIPIPSFKKQEEEK